MNWPTPDPVLKILDAEPVGYCEPDSDHCAWSGAAAADDPTDGTAYPDEDDQAARADLARPTPVSSWSRRLAATSP